MLIFSQQKTGKQSKLRVMGDSRQTACIHKKLNGFYSSRVMALRMRFLQVFMRHRRCPSLLVGYIGSTGAYQPPF